MDRGLTMKVSVYSRSLGCMLHSSFVLIHPMDHDFQRPYHGYEKPSPIDMHTSTASCFLNTNGLVEVYVRLAP